MPYNIATPLVVGTTNMVQTKSALMAVKAALLNDTAIPANYGDMRASLNTINSYFGFTPINNGDDATTVAANVNKLIDLEQTLDGTRFAIDNADTVTKPYAARADFRLDRHLLTGVASGSIAAATTAALINPAISTFADMFTFTRASTATYIDSGGAMQTAAINAPRYDYTNGVRQLLIEGASTNLFLNSATGVTQNITTTAQSYTLSFYGTGSITLSGTATGTLAGTGASNRVSLTVTATAGTLTLTVTGSTTLVQFEALPFASSYIATAGSAVTRAVDTVTLGAKLKALIERNDATIVLKGRGIKGIAPVRLIGTATNARVLGTNGLGAQMVVGNNTPNVAGSGVFTLPLGSFGTAARIGPSELAISYNGAAVGGSALPLVADLSTIYLGRDNASAAYGWFDELIILPFRATNASLQAEAVAYA